jgi:glutamate racemase
MSLIHSFIASPLPQGRTAGIIGGERTIASGLYQQALRQAGNTVRACPSQKLSALIEAGEFEAVPAYLEEVFAVLGDVESLVLACTHYPAVSSIIKKMRPSFELIDPGLALLEQCIQRLGAEPASGGTLRYYTTGDAERSALSAEKAFGFSNLEFIHIPLDLSL